MSKVIKIGIVVIAVIAVAAGVAAVVAMKVDKEEAGEELPLAEIVEKLYEGVDVPGYETIALDESNFEFYAFVPYSEKMSAVAADALINVTPHSLVVIHTDGDGAELAAEVIKNADPNKWLCVGSDIVYVGYTDNYVVLVMSFADTAKDIMDNFKELAPKLDGMEMNMLTAGNWRYEQ